jgi:hypothetical protein
MNPWVLAGLAALVGYVVLSPSTASAATGAPVAGNYWPPTSADQAALSAQLVTYATNAEGTAPSAADVATLNQILAAAPAQYVATLPAGTQPTVTGYQAWIMAHYTSYLTATGIAPNTDPNPYYGGYGDNPYTASASGPLWGFPHQTRLDTLGSGHGLGW